MRGNFFVRVIRKTIRGGAALAHLERDTDGAVREYTSTAGKLTDLNTPVVPILKALPRVAVSAERPFTGLERRAFLYMLDLDADERYVHFEIPGECVCMDILPPLRRPSTPVRSRPSFRSARSTAPPSRSGAIHTERVSRYQVIVLGLKTQRGHTSVLSK